MERRSIALLGLLILTGICLPVSHARAQEDVEGLEGLTKTAAQDQTIQGSDVGNTPNGSAEPLNLRDVWVLKDRLAGEEVADILDQTLQMIDRDESQGPLADTGIHSEIGRQLSVLMKAREDLFTSTQGVDGMFDDLFGTSAPASASALPARDIQALIESYSQLIASLEILKGYSVLAQGPLTTYKGGIAGDGEIQTLAREDLTRARENAKVSVDAIRDTLSSILR